MIAREAHYHTSGRKDYTHTGDCNEKSNNDSKAIEEHAAHLAVFEYMHDYAEESDVEQMSMLKEQYLQFILENSPQLYNPDYKMDKLKSKVVKCRKGQAVELAFEIASSDSMRFEEEALVICRATPSPQNVSKHMPWPPSPGFQLSATIYPPLFLQDFISQ